MVKSIDIELTQEERKDSKEKMAQAESLGTPMVSSLEEKKKGEKDADSLFYQ